MDAQSMLSRMSFKDFLTTQEGRKISRQLVTNLIEQQIGQEHGVCGRVNVVHAGYILICLDRYTE